MKQQSVVKKSLKCTLAAAFAAIVAMTAMLAAPGVAWAEEPATLRSNFEDHAGVVKDTAAVTAAVKEVPGDDLWVVIVKDLNGMDAQDWAHQAFMASGLQKYDGLLVISVGTSELGAWAGRDEAYSGEVDAVTTGVLDEATNDAVLNLFGDGDWDGGVIMLADHVAQLERGESITSNAPAFGGLAVVLAIVVVIVIVVKVRGKKQAKKDAVSLAELAKQAGSELVQVDDSVRSAVQELEFARMEFGLQSTQDYAAALEQAKANIQKAFSLRTLLGDENPETPEQQREMNQQILTLVGATKAALAEQEKAFSELRDLAGRVEEKVAELQTRSGEVRAQLPLTKSKLENLGLHYAPSMFSSLTSYPEQVVTLLENVDKSLADAQAQIAQGEKNEAVGYVKLAEGTLNNAAQLLVKIDEAPQLLEKAQQDLARNIESLSSDVKDAERLGKESAAISAAANTARDALAEANASSGKDLLLLNEKLEDAEANLDAALSSVREAEEARIKAQQNADKARQQANAAINAAEDSINRYRSGVNADTRTYLARAKSAYAQGLQAEGEEALRHFRSAKDLAKNAINSTSRDIRQSSSSSGGSDMGGVLAGMVISSVLNGISSGGGSYSSHSSGSFSSGRSSGGFSNSFGGGGGGGFRKGF